VRYGIEAIHFCGLQRKLSLHKLAFIYKILKRMKKNCCKLKLALTIFVFLAGFPGAKDLCAQVTTATDTIELIIKNKKSVRQCIDDLNALGDHYVGRGKLDDATLTATRCTQLAKDAKYEKGLYDAYSILGTVTYFNNDFEKGRSIANEWLTIASRNKSDYGKNGAEYLRVKLFYKEGSADSVISIAKRVLAAKQANFDSIYIPKFITMLANAYLQLGDFRTANQYYINALMLAEKTNNEVLQSACIGNLAIINQELKNYREALKYHEKALALRMKTNRLHDVAGTYSNIAICYQEMKMLDSAEYFLRKSLALFTQLDSKDNIALAKNNLGQVLLDLSMPDSALFYLQSAQKEFTILGDTIDLARNGWAMGNAWFTLAVAKKNKSYLKKALIEMTMAKSIAEANAMEDLKRNIYKSLAVIYDSSDQPGLAFAHLKKYNAINDSILAEEYTNQIAEMQTKYETEKKEAEIIKLNSDQLLDREKIARQRIVNYSLLAIAGLILISGFIVFRNVQKKRRAEKQVAILEKQNAIENMRSKIAGDVHDDIGASLTRMGLNAQQLSMSATIPGKEKELAEKISLQSKEVIAGMREIIWASNPANDNLKSMLSFMRQYIDRFFDGTTIRAVVNFPHDAGEITLHPEVRRNLFLILKESLNNAVKHSGTDKMDIDFTNENEHFHFNIKDYGKGIDDDSKDDFSNGLRNMEMRAAQIQSLFKLISSPGKGVQIAVSGRLY
jgi:signal transduction histidine kinase